MLPDARVVTVVLNYRGVDDTLACVSALQHSTCLDQALVLVDNGPADSPEHHRLADGLGDRGVLVATGENLGYAGGNNVGIRLALEQDPDFVWLINPDLRVEPTTLEKLLATADEIRDAAALGPRIVHGDSDPSRIWFDGGIFDRLDGRTGHLHDGRPEAELPPGGPRDVDYVTGACLLLRASAVRQVGPIPDDYFLYFEETDYCRRLADRGWRLLVVPQARAVHHKRSSGQLPTVAYTYYMRRNKELFARRMGVDVDAALAHFDRTWISPWRANIGRRAPSWLPVFEEIIELGAADAAAGRTGRRDDLDRFPPADGQLA
jgi:GT2 family glycosyltransferase